MADEAKEEAKKEKQKPIKPKRSGGGGDIKWPVIIGAVLGAIVLMAGLFYAVFIFGILPHFQDQMGGGEEGDKTEKVDGEDSAENTKEGEEEEDDEMSEEEDFMLGDKGVHFVQSGRVTTNPKSSNQIVLLNLGMEFRAKPGDSRFPEEEGGGEGGEGGGGEGLESAAFMQNTLMNVKGKIIPMIGMYTVDELYNINRDTLAVQFKETLKPIFKKEKLFLRKITLLEFLIQ